MTNWDNAMLQLSIGIVPKALRGADPLFLAGVLNAQIK
jgi:hypothetical protein